MATAPDIAPQAYAEGWSLQDFGINGTKPFCSPGDAADQCLEQAHAIALVMATSFHAADGVPNEHDHFETLRAGIKARALEGIATLIALAQHHADAFQLEQRKR